MLGKIPNVNESPEITMIEGSFLMHKENIIGYNMDCLLYFKLLILGELLCNWNPLGTGYLPVPCVEKLESFILSLVVIALTPSLINLVSILKGPRQFVSMISLLCQKAWAHQPVIGIQFCGNFAILPLHFLHIMSTATLSTSLMSSMTYNPPVTHGRDNVISMLMSSP